MRQRRSNIKQRNAVSWLLLVIHAFFPPFMALCLSGCAFNRFGKADVTPYRIKAPEGLIGLTKSQIIDRLGLPEGGIIDEKGTEYWEYNNMNSYYIVLFGQGAHKNLLLQIKDDIVTSIRLIEKGDSFNLLTGGM